MKSNADKCNLLVNTNEKVNIAKDIYKQMHKLEGVKIWSKTHLWQPHLHYVKKIQPFPKYFDKNWGKKSRRIRQIWETLISFFMYFLRASAKPLFVQGRLVAKICLHAVLRFC